MGPNLTINALIQNAVDVTDALAAAGDIVLLFFSDGINVFNKASESMGGAAGEIGVTAGVKFTVAVSPEDAHKLTGAVLTYKMTKAVMSNIGPLGSEQREMAVSYSGTVIVTNLEGGGGDASGYAYTNANRQTIVTGNYSPTKEDDTVFVDNGSEIIITLPDNTRMVGKRIRFKRIGDGDVVIKAADDTVLATLTGSYQGGGVAYAGGNVEVEATTDQWEAFL
jgi:hypothetical protein